IPSVTDDEPLTLLELPEQTYVLPGEVTPDIHEAFEEAKLPEIPDIDAPIAGEPEPVADAHLTPDDGELRPAELLQRRPSAGGGLEGRSDEVRAALVGQRGGTPASEEAVTKGLV